jgi:ABC-type dipeptide/oligopeptide/nickel transport system permease component
VSARRRGKEQGGVIGYIQWRLVRAVPVLLGITTLVFMMIHLLPGDPVTAMLSESSATSAEAVERTRQELGLDDPIPEQYLRYLGNALQGDLGRSIQTHRPVTEMIFDVLPSTLRLTFAAMGTAIVLGIVLGTIAALRQNSWLDTISMVISLLGVSTPIFWLGLVLLYVFAIRLDWVPVTGEGGWQRMVLPALTLGFGAAAIIARLVRASLLEAMRQDFITTARAKGLSEKRTIITHGLRNALIPVVTIIGLQFGALLSGAVITETVFARQGIGQLAVNAIKRRDFPLVQGTVLIAACGYLLVNLLVDISYAWLDPRIKYGKEQA